MKIINFFLCGIILLSSQVACAYDLEHLCEEKKLGVSSCNPCFKSNWCQIGTAGFSTQNPADWYDILTFAFPETTPLSLNRNRGSTQGNVQLNSTGITIGQAGNYSVSITAILTNNNQSYTPLIPIFLVRDGVFDPSDTSSIGGVSLVPFEQITTIQATGVLEYVTAGTTLSIVATNGGSPQPEPIKVVGWSISAFRIPCDPTPQ